MTKQVENRVEVEKHKIIKMKVQRTRIRRDRCAYGVTEAGFNSPDRPQTVEIHVAQFIDTEVNISVNMQRQVPTERKSVEVARTLQGDETQSSHHSNLQKAVKWQTTGAHC